MTDAKPPVLPNLDKPPYKDRYNDDREEDEGNDGDDGDDDDDDDAEDDDEDWEDDIRLADCLTA